MCLPDHASMGLNGCCGLAQPCLKPCQSLARLRDLVSYGTLIFR